MRSTGLSIRLLGDTEVRVDDEPLQVDTRKAVALLIYLAVTGTSSSRDQLCTLLWHELDPERARGALRRTLSVLRKGLDGRWLHTDGDRIRIEAGPEVCVDVDEVGRLLSSVAEHGHDIDVVCRDCRDPLHTAAVLHRGEFMAGFTLRDGADFENWQLHEADAARRRHGRILARLADSLAIRREFAQAAVVARARVDLEPLDESAHRQAMVMSVWAGDRGGALRQYRRCVRVLDEELGVPPLPETSALEERILCDDIPQPPGPQPQPLPHSATNPTIGAAWPTVGRHRELSVLADVSRGPHGGTAVITGAPGVGKTRLLDEVASSAAQAGRRVVRARAYEGEAELGLVVVGEALRSALETWEEPPPLDAFTAVEASKLVPVLIGARDDSQATAPLRDPGAQSRFTEAVCTALATLVGGHGILLLDDLQWADSASLDLIGYLLRRGERFRVLTVMAWRTPPPGAHHPLDSVIAELEDNGSATVMALSPLGPDDIRQLATQIAPRLDDASTEAVVENSDGLPLVALEYLSLVDPESGALAEDAVQLSEVAEARLRGVGVLARQVLAAASVIGRSFEPDEARAASGRSEDEATRALEELVGSGLLHDVEAGRLDFRHDLVRHHARDSLSAVRRRQLHRRLADHLIRHHRGGPSRHSGRIAHHLEEAGRLEEAGTHRAAAAAHARSVFAHQEAMGHYEAALALGHPDAVTLHLGIGDLHTLSGDYSAALDAYRAAAARAHNGRLATVEHRMGEVNGRLGRWEPAEHHFEQARRRMTDPGEMVELYTDWARLAGRVGDDERARRLVDEAADQAAAAEGQELWPMVLIMQGLLSAEAAEGRSRVERGLDLARRASDPGSEAAGLNALARLSRRQGRLEEAIGHVHAALEVVERIGDRHRQATAHDLLADLLHESGDEEASRSELTKAVQIFAEVGTGGLEPEIWKAVPW